MAKGTVGLGGVIDSRSRSGQKWSDSGRECRKTPPKKTCRICGALWIPLNKHSGRRDICYSPECERDREADRRKQRRERYRKKKAERERKAKRR